MVNDTLLGTLAGALLFAVAAAAPFGVDATSFAAAAALVAVLPGDFRAWPPEPAAMNRACAGK